MLPRGFIAKRIYERAYLTFNKFKYAMVRKLVISSVCLFNFIIINKVGKKLLKY